MADIANRSRFRVTVRNRDDLTQHFSYNKLKDVESYTAQLRADGYRPRVEQPSESCLARVRQTGYKPLSAIKGS